MKNANEPLAYGVAAAAEVMGSSPTIVRGLIKQNHLPAKKLGAKVLILRDDLRAYLESLEDA